MVDNITIPAQGTGTSTPVVATDDVSGVHFQKIKIDGGGDGVSSPIGGDTTNGLDVDVTRMPTGSSATQVQGSVADDSAVAQNPVHIGGVMKLYDGTDPGSLSAEDDIGYLTIDNNRRLYVNPFHARFWRANENNATAQTNNAIVSAPGASLSLYLQTLIISNGATAGNVKLVEDTAGTPVDIVGPYYFAANGGIAVNFEPPLKLTANKDLGYTSTTVTTHTVTVIGYTAP